MEHQNVFVIGCERSGTTALTLVLASHFSIVVGVERYQLLYREARLRRDPEILAPDLFERDRFLAYDAADTRLVPAETRFVHIYEAMEQRFGSDLLRWVGDKVLPPDEWLMRTLAERYPRSRFLFISRDPVRVANSFEVRARNPEDRWPAENGYRLAIEHWNDAAKAVGALRADIGDDRVRAVTGEDFFGPSIEVCRSAFAFLDLDLWEGTEQAWRAHHDAWTDLQQVDLVLTPDQEREVHDGIDPEAVDVLDEVLAAAG